MPQPPPSRQLGHRFPARPRLARGRLTDQHHHPARAADRLSSTERRISSWARRTYNGSAPGAAAARHRSELLDHPVYDGPDARAAALGRCRWLERSNMAVAAATGVMYLEASGIPVKPTHEDAVALRDLLQDPTCTAARIAALLRAWPQTT